jgi:hypothetical protein
MPPTTRRRDARLRGLAILAALSVPGCIFFVGDNPSLETTACHFQGSGTSCGQCVVTNCQRAVDACCTASDCEGQLSNLDQCAESASPTACAALASSDNSSSTFVALGACIRGSCGSECLGPAIVCAALGGTNSCSCGLSTGLGTYGDIPEATCNDSTGPCCAQTGWPSEYTQCNCDAAFLQGCSSGTSVTSCSP